MRQGKLARLWNVVTGKDKKELEVAIKQAEEKGKLKAEIEANRKAQAKPNDIFEAVDTETVVPVEVINTLKDKILDKFQDSEVAKGIYKLMAQDFERMFTPELCFELIVNVNAVDDLIDRYINTYLTKEKNKVVGMTLLDAFRHMDKLTKIFYPDGIPEVVKEEPVAVVEVEPVVEEVAATEEVKQGKFKEVLPEELKQQLMEELKGELNGVIDKAIDSRQNVVKAKFDNKEADKMAALMAEMFQQGFNPKPGQKVMVAGDIEKLINQIFG